MKTFQPDIVVISPDGDYLMVIEVKLNPINTSSQDAIEHLKLSMTSIGCSVGFVVLGERIILLRDSLEEFNGESIHVVGEANLPASLLPPPDEQWKGTPALEFESQVQRWLEQLKLTATTDSLPTDLKDLLSAPIINLLQLGEVRSAGPRWSKVAA